MDQPNASDRALLQLLDEQTRLRDGQSPTLSELARAAGLQTSSRANIQRQLARLRPTYVDWTDSPRSLRLTSSGLTLIGRSAGAGVIGSPLPWAALPLLARGLTQLCQEHTEGRIPAAPYNLALQRGTNILAACCLLNGLPPPVSLASLAQEYLRKPPAQWSLALEDTARLYDEPLLVDMEPTALCRELAALADGGDAEYEVCEQLMGVIRKQAQVARRQEGYVALRQLVITHPVLPEEDLVIAGFGPLLAPFAAALLDLYEQVPRHLEADGHVLICGACGWTLERYEGRLRCGSERCRVLTNDFTRGTTSLSLPVDGALLRVRAPIRRYITAPGRAEVAMAQALEQAGASVALWPTYDRYDLHVTLPNGQRWAIDIKDWRHAHLLGRVLAPITPADDSGYDAAFYAIPDERVRETPQYLSLLGVGPHQPYQVVTISELVARAKRVAQETRHA